LNDWLRSGFRASSKLAYVPGAEPIRRIDPWWGLIVLVVVFTVELLLQLPCARNKSPQCHIYSECVTATKGWASVMIPSLLPAQGFYPYAFPILNIFVPHTGHVPWVAGLPFFMVIDLGSFISLLARHFTQYACISSPPASELL